MEETHHTQHTREYLIVALAALFGACVGALMMERFFFQQTRFPSTQRAERSDVNPHVVQLIEEESATIDVVNTVAPSVVSVVLKKPQNQFRGFGSEGNSELVEVSSGTGFFVSSDGLLLTNRHVIDEPNVQFFVVTNNGSEYTAKVIDVDPFQDIAVMQVDGTDFHAVTLGDSQKIRIGQTVIAIGNTLSEFRNTVTKGVVSGIDRKVTAATQNNAEVIEKAIQTDAAINPGNSGGPLINLLGEVIGINTAISSEGESVGFAIPIDQAKRVVNDVKEFGRIVRPWLGVRYVLVEQESMDRATVAYEIGAMVSSGNQPGQKAVFDESPAAHAGLKEGDVIIAINNKNLTHASALSERISEFRPGDTIHLTFLRSGMIEETSLTLAEYTE